MTVANPDFLELVNDAGTAWQNYGSASGNYTVQQGTSPTHYEFHGNADKKLAYVDIKTNSSANMPYWATAATVPGNDDTVALKATVKFRVDALHLGQAASILTPTNGQAEGMIILAQTPAGSGDYDLLVKVLNQFFSERVLLFSALTFGVDYIISASFDPSTLASTVLRAKLDGGSVQTDGPASYDTDGFENAWPQLARRWDFNDNFGLLGRLYYAAYDRGGTPWSSSDLNDINSDPASAITGWPGGGPATIYVAPLPQRNRRKDGRYL